jgi:pimeloyl-ACP methyl ester carboxylesterase
LPAINVALELGDRLQGLVLLAPGLFIPPAIKERTQREFAAHPDAAEDSPVLRSALTPEMFSARSDVCQFIRDDPLCQPFFTPRFFRVTQEMSLIAATRLSQLKQRLLLLLAAQDQTADNERTVKTVGRLPGSAVTIATLDCHHGMQFERPHEMAAHIYSWIDRRPPQQ